MKTILIIAAVLMSIGSTSASATTVDSTDLKRVVDCMKNRSCQGTIFNKEYYGLGEQVVFVQGGRRYTFVWYRLDNGLTIWTRPEGTSTQAALLVFSDIDLDGQTDFGVTGRAFLAEPDKRRKYFHSTKMPPHCDSTGEEFQQYWNERYTEAISAAIRVIIPKPRSEP